MNGELSPKVKPSFIPKQECRGLGRLYIHMLCPLN